MARPKKSESEAADVRLINALWALLETKRLADITVGTVTAQAGLNRGTFYYHFTSLDALIDRAIEGEVAGRNSIMPNVLSMIAGSTTAEEAKNIMEQRARRITLLIRQGGVEALSAKVKSLSYRIWQAVLCDGNERLTPETTLVIEYATSGIIGIFVHNALDSHNSVPPEFFVSFIRRNSNFLLSAISEAQNVPKETLVSRLQATIRLNRLQ